MPAHTSAWNNATPVGSDLASSIDDFMRAMKLDVDERMSLQHYWGDAIAVGNNQDGTHKEITVTPVTTNAELFKTNANQSLTGSSAVSAIDIGITWNTTGAPSAIKVNITNTASGAAAKLIDMQIAGTSIFDVEKNGDVNVANTAGFYARNSATTPTLIGRLDGSNIIEYGSDDASGVVGVKFYGVTDFKWVMNSGNTRMQLFNTGILYAGSAAAGAVGAWRMVPQPGSPVSVRHEFGSDGSGWEMRFAKNVAGVVTDLWGIHTNGHLIPVANNSYDIGTTALRTRTVCTVGIDISGSFTGNLIPAVNNTQNIGSTSFRINTLFAQSLNVTNGPTVTGTSGGIVLTAPASQGAAITMTSGAGGGAPNILMNSGDFGASVIGPMIQIGRNSNASASSGAIVMTNILGTAYAIWVDSAGKLRIGTTLPAGGANDTSGTIVGTQA